MNIKRPNYHAHFDCFSGAAGDMMLAACLDVADSLPYPLPLQFGASNNITGGNDADEKNSDKLLSQVVHDLEGGLPELKGEFKLSVKVVWRSTGMIAAKKIDVDSVYNHEAAPVPGAESKTTTTTNEVKEKAPKDAHSHEHKHQHRHDHKHSTADDVDEEKGKKETHNHNHSHGHSHSGGSAADDNVDEKVKEDPLTADSEDGHNHNHSHGHSHGHSHSHGGHSNNHSNSHNHSHGHSHGHDHQSGGQLRNLPQIKQMLKTAPSKHIPSHIATLAIDAFTALAHAEMATHGAESIDQVHFHEVGAVDSIVDTVGTLLALHHLGVDLGSSEGDSVAISCSALPLGEGTVWTDHGLLPVPAPATLRLMIGMPTCPGPKGVTGELVTPTAAALLRVLTGADSGRDDQNDGSYWQARSLPGRPPSMIPRAVGVGAGTKDFEKHPNVLRLILGDNLHSRAQQNSSGNTEQSGEEAADLDTRSNAEESNNDSKNVSECKLNISGSDEGKRSGPKVSSFNTIGGDAGNGSKVMKQKPKLWDMHTLTHMNANIDDATPELLAHAIDLLIKNGAIDAWVQPIVMKKGRPAHSLNCICRCESPNEAEQIDTSAESRLLNIMFRHTTTLGIRIQRNILRAALKRRFVEVQLPYANNVRSGKVDVKISSYNDGEVLSVKAEFDQCKVVSEESDVPLKIVSSAAERLAWDHHVNP